MTLEVKQLHVYFTSKGEPLHILDGVSFKLNQGETLGIVGESGCGKSMTVLSIMRLISKPPLQKVTGMISWKGQNLLEMPLKAMRKIRGNEISMIFQE
ncbi:MAG: ABC transporter ATP-binding protein, partial [Planctomycetes bacterium]|nr:ABC transporter ATP-binding protein [Planctomycetota bacterium]